VLDIPPESSLQKEGASAAAIVGHWRVQAGRGSGRTAPCAHAAQRKPKMIYRGTPEAWNFCLPKFVIQDTSTRIACIERLMQHGSPVSQRAESSPRNIDSTPISCARFRARRYSRSDRVVESATLLLQHRSDAERSTR
jgi:hypothetical protein